MEVAYLLLYGNLPDKRQAGTWRNAVMAKTALPEAVVNVMAALPKDAHPMGAMVAGEKELIFGFCVLTARKFQWPNFPVLQLHSWSVIAGTQVRP